MANETVCLDKFKIECQIYETVSFCQISLMKKMKAWEEKTAQCREMCDKVRGADMDGLLLAGEMANLEKLMEQLRRDINGLPGNAIDAAEEELRELEDLYTSAKDGGMRGLEMQETAKQQQLKDQSDKIKQCIVKASPLYEAIMEGLTFIRVGDEIQAQLGEDKQRLIHIKSNLDIVIDKANEAIATTNRMESHINKKMIISISECVFIFLVLVALIILKATGTLK